MSATEGNHGQPPSEEPKTPMWLTAVGAALFLTVGLIWGLSSPSKDVSQTSTTASTASAAPDSGAPAAKKP